MNLQSRYHAAFLALFLSIVSLGLIASGCSTSTDTGDAVSMTSIDELQARFEENNRELKTINDGLRSWRSEFSVEASEADLLLSLFTRPLAFHSMEPSDSSEYGRRFQALEQRVAKFRRTEFDIATDHQKLVEGLDKIADDNPDAVELATIDTPVSIASLPVGICPNPLGCDGPGGPRNPCKPFITSGARICYLTTEHCGPTIPRGGWIQTCNYKCLPLILF